MIKSGNNTFWLAAAALALHGCAMAPGMKAQSTGQVEVEQGTVVQVQPITMELLDRLDAERQAAMQSLVEDFSQPKEPYRIGPGDVLQIIVLGSPRTDYSCWRVPGCGDVRPAGRRGRNTLLSLHRNDGRRRQDCD